MSSVMVWMMGQSVYLQQIYYDTKFGGVVDTTQRSAAIQRDFHKLDKWADRNVVKFSNGKCWVPHLESNNSTHQHLLQIPYLKSSVAEKDLGVSWTANWTWASTVPFLQRWLVSWSALDKILPAGCDPSRLLSSGEAIPTMLGPILESLVQETQTYCRDSCEEPGRWWGDRNISAWLRQKDERAGAVQSGGKKAQEGACSNIYAYMR